MTVPGPKMLSEERALEMLNAIMQSDVDACYKEAILSLANENGEIQVEDTYEISARLAFCNPKETLPAIVSEFVSLAFLDEIENDNDAAMVDLGSLYYTGRIGEQNYTEAIKYYKMADACGNLIASENLGYCYYYGRDVEVDYKAAYHYFIKPALAGRLESMYKIGDMYAKGLYVNQDEGMAKRLIRALMTDATLLAIFAFVWATASTTEPAAKETSRQRCSSISVPNFSITHSSRTATFSRERCLRALLKKSKRFAKS